MYDRPSSSSLLQSSFFLALFATLIFPHPFHPCLRFISHSFHISNPTHISTATSSHFLHTGVVNPNKLCKAHFGLRGQNRMQAESLRPCKGRPICFEQNSSKSLARCAIRVELSKTTDLCFAVSVTHFNSIGTNFVGVLQLTNHYSIKEITRTC